MQQTTFTDALVEQARLACLRNLKILDTAADDRIDRITAMASSHFNVPIALISLLDDERQWFKSRVGLDAMETPRCMAFCDYTIRKPDVFVVQNAAKDERFASNPLVTGDPNIRFYAGAPVTISETHRIGTLCLIDRKPRDFSEHDAAKLMALARSVEQMIVSIYQSRETLSTLSDFRLPNDQADVL